MYAETPKLGEVMGEFFLDVFNMSGNEPWNYFVPKMLQNQKWGYFTSQPLLISLFPTKSIVQL